MKIVMISDTHTYHSRMKHPIPDGDMIIHAGDFMSSGFNPMEYIPFLKWYSSLPHKHKILIAGNHDRYTQMFETAFIEDVNSFKNITYLRDSGCVIDGIKIYGSPWQRWFNDWSWNFPNHHRNPHHAEAAAIDCWNKIPTDTNILVTHGQPYSINDKAPDGELTGCGVLLDVINKKLIDLKLYVGGHIHDEYGIKVIDNVTYVNASICTEAYSPDNAPIVIDL